MTSPGANAGLTTVGSPAPKPDAAPAPSVPSIEKAGFGQRYWIEDGELSPFKT